MFGSLNDFIDLNIPQSVQNGKQDSYVWDDIQPVSPLTKMSRKTKFQRKSKRAMSGVENYKATDKSLLFEKFSKNYSQIQEAKALVSKTKEEKNSNRKPISQSRLSSLFYGHNPLKSTDQSVVKDQYGGLSYKVQEEKSAQLKRGHNLLRAIVRTKMNEEKKIANTHYQDSFQRLSLGLKNIKIRQVADSPEVAISQEPQTNRSLQFSIERKNKTSLNNKIRLQFENCLNWTKRRNKNGSFYAQKLGKNSKIQVNNKSVENRKSLLQFIHNKSTAPFSTLT